MHLSQALYEIAERHPRKEAIVFEGRRITWGELNERVENLARWFLALGVERGERVGMMCQTRPEYIFVYLAAARVGAALVGFNVHYTAREVRDLAVMTRPAVMVVQGKLGMAKQLAPVLEDLPFIRHRIAGCDLVPPGWLSLEPMLASPPDDWGQAILNERAASLSEEDAALLVFTGGVTGTPKAAVLTHKNIIANITAQNRHLGWRPDDRVLLHLPMNHVSGATLITVGALLSGATMIMLERFHPEQALRLVEQERVTILGQVPTMWIMEFMAPDFETYDLSSVRMAIVSGAPTPTEVMARMAALAPYAVHGYGLTEATGMVTYVRPDDPKEEVFRSAGRAAPEFEVRIVDGAGNPLGPDKEGEIEVRGACVMLGYFENPVETALVLDEKGWLRTGDRGRLDERGHLTVTGRSKRMYISGGYNVYPLEVEQYLETHPDIIQARCEAASHPIMGETGRVFVVPKPGAALTSKLVRAYCKKGLARYKNPAFVHVVKSLDGESED